MSTGKQVTNILSAFLAVLCVMIAPQLSQAQDGINYQAVARDGSGNVMANKTISVRLTVNNASSSQVYQEVHNNVSTNAYGLFTLVVGSQNPSNFSSVDWSAGGHELVVDLDPNNGTNWTTMGTQALQNVPYSLHADMEMGELNNVSTGNVSSGEVLAWDGSSWTPTSISAGGDDWGSQVAQTGATIEGDGTSGNVLNIAQQGASDGQVLKWDANSSTWVPGSDNTGGSGGVNADATIDGDGTAGNPLSVAQQGASSGEVLQWTGSGWAPATDQVADADDDPTNEQQTLSISGSDLSISSGNTVTLPSGGGTVNTTNRLTGDGSGGSPLDIAQQGASSGQVLKWNGSSWAPGSDNTGGSGGVNTDATIDGDGSNTPLGIAQQNANSGQVLKWNGSSWAPAQDAGTQYSAGTGINITGSNAIENTGDTNPSDDLNTGEAAGGDLSGTYPDPSVDAINGIPVVTANLSSGDVLEYDGTDWVPASNSGGGSSVWSTSGSDAYYSAGNAGIGTSSPSSPLHVSAGGSEMARFESNISSKWISFYEGSTRKGILWNTNNDMVLQADEPGGDVQFHTEGNNTRMTVESDGNVGIGNTSPSELLDVSGSINLTGALSVSGNSGTNGQVLTSTGSGLQWQSVSGSGDNLGDHTATQELDMNSNNIDDNSGTTPITIDQSIEVNESNDLAIQTSGQNDEDAYISAQGSEVPSAVGANSGYEISVLGISNGSSGGDNFGIMGYSNHVAGWFEHDGTGNLVELANSNAAIDIQSGEIRDNNGSTGTSGEVLTSTGSGVEWQSGGGGSSVWSTSSSDAYYSAGNVGISTTNPSNELTVDGDADITGNVGIGTSSPSGALHITATSTSIDNGIQMTSSQNSSEDWYQYLDVNDNYVIRDDASDVFTIENSSGNVGIGTSSPTNNLHIKEDGSSSDAKAILDAPSDQSSTIEFRETGTFAGSVGYSHNTGQEYIYLYEGSNALIAKNGQVNVGSNNDPDNELSVDGSANVTGNVGIGTSSPQSNLHVSGTNNQEWIDIRSGQNDTSGIRLRERLSNDYGVNLFFDGDGNRFIMDGVDNSGNYYSNPFTFTRNDGNVGINTVSPSYQLEVDGDAAKPGGGNWTAPSDARLKQNVSSYEDGLAKVMKIDPVSYQYNKKSGFDTEEEYVGVIAQEVKDIAPYMVGTYEKADEEFYDVNNSAMTYMLINSVQEQQKIIEEQKQENKELKQELNKIKSALAEEGIEID